MDTQKTEESPKKPQVTRERYKLRLIDILVIIVCIPFIPLFLLIGLIMWICWLIEGLWLVVLVRLSWYPKGKRLLFVYSNSPNWKEYIETSILPQLGPKAVVINWSERQQWKWVFKPMELVIFRHYTHVSRFFIDKKMQWDGKDFNPVAVVFIPWWRPKVLRFWQAFKDLKHGKDGPLKKLEASLFEILRKGL